MIPQFLRVTFILLEVVVLFNLLIIVHELGHFLAARWRGLVIESSASGSASRSGRRRSTASNIRSGSIPFGGFVKLPQLAPMDIIEGKVGRRPRAAPGHSALDKIIVAFAGPLFSMLLALVFACVVWVVGHPISESDVTTVVGYVPARFARRQGRLAARATRSSRSTASRSPGSAA